MYNCSLNFCFGENTEAEELKRLEVLKSDYLESRNALVCQDKETAIEKMFWAKGKLL